jgi:hypothetical protein
MLILSNTSSIIRLYTSAAGDIEVDASYVDFTSPSTYAPDGVITPSITTATTTTIVASPAASTKRNVRTITATNNHVSVINTITVEKFDGTNAAELMSFTLLPGENMVMNANGDWTHHDANGAKYPAAGLGAYNGRSVDFMKTGTASDAAGYWYCTSKDAGFPGAWAVGTPGLNGRNTDGTTSTDNGCLVISNPATGGNYITEFDIGSSVAHTHMFFDCLWVNSGLVITTTTAQTITQAALPARDVNGSTNGEGLTIALLCTAAVGLAAVASNATVSYTNSDGTAGRTATLSAIVGSQAPATPVIGTLIWFNLAAGDKGVRSIQSITLGTSWVSGSISLMICRMIAQIGTTIANVSANKKPSSPGIRIYNGSCILHCALTSATTATLFTGDISVVEK